MFSGSVNALCFPGTLDPFNPFCVFGEGEVTGAVAVER